MKPWKTTLMAYLGQKGPNPVDTPENTSKLYSMQQPCLRVRILRYEEQWVCSCMRYVTKSNASHKSINTFLPLQLRGILDLALASIARIVCSSCLISPDTRSFPLKIDKKGGINFSTFRRTFLLALEEDPLEPLGPGINEDKVRDRYYNRDGTMPDLAQTLRESIEARARTGSGSDPISSK